MKKVYVLTATFSCYDSYYDTIKGVYSSLETATEANKNFVADSLFEDDDDDIKMTFIDTTIKEYEVL